MRKGGVVPFVLWCLIMSSTCWADTAECSTKNTRFSADRCRIVQQNQATNHQQKVPIHAKQSEKKIGNLTDGIYQCKRYMRTQFISFINEVMSYQCVPVNQTVSGVQSLQTVVL